MAQYQVISDSCSDYTDQEDLSFIRRVPLTIHLDDCLYVDDEKLDCQALVQTMAATSSAPKSACPSPGAWEEAFEAADGDIYVVTLSGELSGSYNSAVVAAQSYVHEHPERRIHVFNSRSAAAGQVLICLKLRELAGGQGLPFEEVVRRTEEYIGTMSTYFVLETLDVFRKNGRLSRLQSLAVGALRLKMVMRGTQTGYIEAAAKALSVQQALNKMVLIIRERAGGKPLSDRTLIITYVNCLERAAAVRDSLMKECGFGRAILCRGSGISTIYANDGGIIVSY